MSSEKIVVCGAGGFIGGHLVADLIRQGHRSIRAVDLSLLMIGISIPGSREYAARPSRPGGLRDSAA